jgi:HD-GYP domain-containing protein (c-di-GMP phosphodiesterase class II)
MANLGVLLSPKVQDYDALKDFMQSMPDLVTKIERDIAKLGKSPDDGRIVADIFRALHTIKGDASMCKVDMVVEIAHPIESLLSRLRSGQIHYSQMLGEILLLAVDRLELATEALVAGKSVDNLRLIVLVLGLYELCKVEEDKLDEAAAKLLESITGFRPKVLAVPASNKMAAANKSETTVKAGEKIAADLRFFRSLAMQLESRSPLFKGRTARILSLALESNKTAGLPVDQMQLEAAVYMHDLGMMLLPESVWLKVGNLSDEEKKMLPMHADYGAGVLQRMEGWEGAAEMVLQHHEMHDGGGYPGALKGDQICAGAKILAIVDAFEAVTLKHSHRGHNRSVIRAISEVNACNNQFAPEWIRPFNAVIRRMVGSDN